MEEKFSLLGIEMPLEEFDFLMCEQAKGKELKVKDGKVIAEYHIETYEEKQERLRGERAALLNAFDKYKSNVDYGIERETELQHENIIAWYRDLLDLKEYALNNIPERIKYYL